jgi:hypothetical protein
VRVSNGRHHRDGRAAALAIRDELGLKLFELFHREPLQEHADGLIVDRDGEGELSFSDDGHGILDGRSTAAQDARGREPGCRGALSGWSADRTAGTRAIAV